MLPSQKLIECAISASLPSLLNKKSLLPWFNSQFSTHGFITWSLLRIGNAASSLGACCVQRVSFSAPTGWSTKAQIATLLLAKLFSKTSVKASTGLANVHFSAGQQNLIHDAHSTFHKLMRMFCAAQGLFGSFPIQPNLLCGRKRDTNSYTHSNVLYPVWYAMYVGDDTCFCPVTWVPPGLCCLTAPPQCLLIA